MKRAKVTSDGMKEATKLITPAPVREPSRIGFRPSESDARPQKGAVRIIPEIVKVLLCASKI